MNLLSSRSRPCRTPPRTAASAPSREPAVPGPRPPSSQPFSGRGAWQRIPRILVPLSARSVRHIPTSMARALPDTPMGANPRPARIHARHSQGHAYTRGHTHVRARMGAKADKLGAAPSRQPRAVGHGSLTSECLCVSGNRRPALELLAAVSSSCSLTPQLVPPGTALIKALGAPGTALPRDSGSSSTGSPEL